MSDDIPPHWIPDLERRGLTSYRKIANAAGFSHETARRVITGRPVTEGTVSRFAVAVGIDPDRVWQLRGQNAPDRSRAWEPPAASSSLTDEEREALSRLITLMTRERRAGGGDGNAAPMSADDAPPPAKRRRAPDLVIARPDGTALYLELKARARHLDSFDELPPSSRRLGQEIYEALGAGAGGQFPGGVEDAWRFVYEHQVRRVAASDDDERGAFTLLPMLDRLDAPEPTPDPRGPARRR